MKNRLLTLMLLGSSLLGVVGCTSGNSSDSESSTSTSVPAKKIGTINYHDEVVYKNQCDIFDCIDQSSYDVNRGKEFKIKKSIFDKDYCKEKFSLRSSRVAHSGGGSSYYWNYSKWFNKDVSVANLTYDRETDSYCIVINDFEKNGNVFDDFLTVEADRDIRKLANDEITAEDFKEKYGLYVVTSYTETKYFDIIFEIDSFVGDTLNSAAIVNKLLNYKTEEEYMDILEYASFNIQVKSNVKISSLEELKYAYDTGFYSSESFYYRLGSTLSISTLLKTNSKNEAYIKAAQKLYEIE